MLQGQRAQQRSNTGKQKTQVEKDCLGLSQFTSELSCLHVRHCVLATKATPGTTTKSASPSSVATKLTRPTGTIRTKNPLLSSKATVPITKGKREYN